MKSSNNKSFSLKDAIILFVIIAIALVFRLYKIDVPLADLHSWRQADTAAVSRNFVRYGFDLMHPVYDDLTSIQSGLPNPTGLRFVEFPLYNAFFTATYKVAPFTPIEVHGRVVSIFFSLVLLVVLYYLSLKESSRITAVFSSLVFAIFPAFVFFSRVVLPEMTATSFAFLAILFLYKVTREDQNRHATISMYLLLSAAAFSCAILIKPTAIFYGVTLLFLVLARYKFGIWKELKLYIYAAIALIPLLLWRKYIAQFPYAIPSSTWLITSVNTFEGQKNIFMKPAFFRWVFFERISLNIFGGYLIAPFFVGILGKAKGYMLHSILGSAILYLLIFQGGNVQHEYYQILILPAFALFVGLGAHYIYENRSALVSPMLAYPVILVFFLFSFFFSYYRIKDYYNIPLDLVQISNIIITLTKESDKIVTDRQGDTTLLYLSNRRGSPALFKSPEEFKAEDYKYIVTANKDSIESLKKKYQIIFQNNEFTIVKL